MGEITERHDEPASVAPPAAGAGSTSSRQPPLVNDVVRALICALLVSSCIAAPSTALLFAPFVPLLFAIRITRHRAGARRFAMIATSATIASAVLTVTDTVELDGAEGIAYFSAAILTALLLVPVLGVVHARAVRHDPVQHPVSGADAAAEIDWPEPRIDSGFSLTVIAWSVAIAMVAAGVLPVLGNVTNIARDAIESGYSVYVDACADEGSLASYDEFCTNILEQRDRVLELVGDHAGELVGVLLATFAFGAAATAHLLALARLRHASDRIRRGWRLRELETHWSSTYLVVIGIAALLLVDGTSAAVDAVRSMGIALGALGALLLGTRGLGLLAWLLTRPRVPTWYRVMVVIGSLFVIPVTLVLLFAAGVLDQALQPRRRAARSANLPDRGSGR